MPALAGSVAACVEISFAFDAEMETLTLRAVWPELVAELAQKELAAVNKQLHEVHYALDSTAKELKRLAEAENAHAEENVLVLGRLAVDQAKLRRVLLAGGARTHLEFSAETKSSEIALRFVPRAGCRHAAGGFWETLSCGVHCVLSLTSVDQVALRATKVAVRRLIYGGPGSAGAGGAHALEGLIASNPGLLQYRFSERLEGKEEQGRKPARPEVPFVDDGEARGILYLLGTKLGTASRFSSPALPDPLTGAPAAVKVTTSASAGSSEGLEAWVARPISAVNPVHCRLAGSRGTYVYHKLAGIEIATERQPLS